MPTAATVRSQPDVGRLGLGVPAFAVQLQTGGVSGVSSPDVGSALAGTLVVVALAVVLIRFLRARRERRAEE